MSLLVVRPGQRGTGGVMSGTQQNMTLDDAAALLTQVNGIRAIAPVVSGSGQLKYFGKNARATVMGTSITYIAGNHDEFARQFQGVHFGGIVVADRAIHETADGRRLLVIHGDQFDTVVHNARWLAYLGDYAYDAAMLVNRVVTRLRQLLGLPYWSFSSWAKVNVKKAVNFIGSFQTMLTEEARRSHVDGVICGHIHHAAIEDYEDVQYINTGDWVETCSAVVEDASGELQLLRWSHAGQGGVARVPGLAAMRDFRIGAV